MDAAGSYAGGVSIASRSLRRLSSVMIHEFVKERPTIFENMASAVAVQTNGLAAVL